MPFIHGGINIKKIDKKINILNKAGVFLLAITIVLSIVSVQATTEISSSDTNTKEYTKPGNGIISDIILQEGFEDNVMPPDDWTYTGNQDPPYTWHIVDSSDPDVGVYNGDYAAAVKRYHISAQDEKIITPELNLNGYGDVTLEFWAASWTWNPSATVKVIIEGDGISDVIWDMIIDEEWETVEYRNIILDLTGYVDETITICFQYIGIQGWNFGLDDILVYGGDAPIPPEPEIGEITGGWAGLGNGGKVSAEIKNVAEIGADDALDVEWSISATGSGILQKINESDNGNISSISPGGVEIVELVVGQHIGRINITVTAYEPHFDLFVLDSVEGFIFIGFVFILKG